MANRLANLFPLETDFKEINQEDYKECFDQSQEEVARLERENRELVVSRDKLNRKWAKKKNQLEIEKSHLITSRQLIQELNAKIIQLENTLNSRPNSENIGEHPSPFLATSHTEEFVEKLLQEKTGLESKISEQNCQIEFLNSELISYKKLGTVAELGNSIETLNRADKDLMLQLIRSKCVELKKKKSNFTERITNKTTETDEIKITEAENTISDFERKFEETPIKTHFPGIYQKNQRSPTRPFMTSSSVKPKISPQTQLIQAIAKNQPSKQPDSPIPTGEETPSISLILNSTSKTSKKITFRPGICVNVVTLKAVCKAMSHQPVKQVIIQVNKRYELGLLMIVFEMDNKVGFRNSISRFAGIRLYNTVGNSKGEFGGKYFFECDQNCGLFLPAKEVLVPVL